MRSGGGCLFCLTEHTGSVRFSDLSKYKYRTYSQISNVDDGKNTISFILLRRRVKAHNKF